MKNLIYTVGCGNKSNEQLCDSLMNYNINCVVDIRNEPTKVEELKKILNKKGIYYIPMYNEFDLSEKVEEFFDFEAARISLSVKSGIERIENGLSKGFNIVIMGEEENPLNCNRGILISYILKNKGINIKHLISEDLVKCQKDLEDELLKFFGVKLIKKVAELSIKGIMKNKDLEMDEKDFTNEMIEEAYRIRYKEILKKNAGTYD
ncbi:DUF488 domain-containing protein [Clostridium felsineum]|uniref:DUF488 domain-containing protein n=1 Tax=Clostridium felsineum TaxID=36839 RepID=UPI00214D37F5|nr:DUF488 domain-containing protein [Clostridium felsineum]MCR3760086.1 DUF488 domain-containing protein [Clostridium felsineum]